MDEIITVGHIADACAFKEIHIYPCKNWMVVALYVPTSLTVVHVMVHEGAYQFVFGRADAANIDTRPHYQMFEGFEVVCIIETLNRTLQMTYGRWFQVDNM